MAKQTMTSGKAIVYLGRLYGITASRVTLRNWVLKGRQGISLKADIKRSKSDRRSYVFTASRLSEFVKAVGKGTLTELKRGRPVIV